MSKNINPSPFLRLPNELLYMICNKLDATDRYNFSEVCKNFNSVAMCKKFYPSPFLRLPNKILCMIFTKLDTTDRHNFSKVCKHFNAVAMCKKFRITHISKDQSNMSYGILKTFLQEDQYEELPDKSLGIKLNFEPGAHLTNSFLAGLRVSEPQAKQITFSQCFVLTMMYHMYFLPNSIETLIYDNITHCEDLKTVLNAFRWFMLLSHEQCRLPNLRTMEMSFKSKPELFQIYLYAVYDWFTGPLYLTVFEEDSEKRQRFIGKLFKKKEQWTSEFSVRKTCIDNTKTMLNNLKDKGFFRGREVKSVSMRRNTGPRAFNAQGKLILDVSMTVIVRRN